MDTEIGMIDVKALRRALGLTQAQFGAEVGVDQSTVSNWENGAAPRGPARKLLLSLAERSASAPASLPEKFGESSSLPPTPPRNGEGGAFPEAAE